MLPNTQRAPSVEVKVSQLLQADTRRPGEDEASRTPVPLLGAHYSKDCLFENCLLAPPTPTQYLLAIHLSLSEDDSEFLSQPLHGSLLVSRKNQAPYVRPDLHKALRGLGLATCLASSFASLPPCSNHTDFSGPLHMPCALS